MPTRVHPPAPLSSAALRWSGPPLALQIMGLLLTGLVVAQLVTLVLTWAVPPEPPPQYDLRDIADVLAGTPRESGGRRLQRLLQAEPLAPAGPGWLTSDRSRVDLARLLDRDQDDVQLWFYTPLPFAGTATAARRISALAEATEGSQPGQHPISFAAALPALHATTRSGPYEPVEAPVLLRVDYQQTANGPEPQGPPPAFSTGIAPGVLAPQAAGAGITGGPSGGPGRPGGWPGGNGRGVPSLPPQQVPLPLPPSQFAPPLSGRVPITGGTAPLAGVPRFAPAGPCTGSTADGPVRCDAPPATGLAPNLGQGGTASRAVPDTRAPALSTDARHSATLGAGPARSPSAVVASPQRESPPRDRRSLPMPSAALLPGPAASVPGTSGAPEMAGTGRDTVPGSPAPRFETPAASATGNSMGSPAAVTATSVPDGAPSAAAARARSTARVSAAPAAADAARSSRGLFGFSPAPFVEGDFVAALRVADGWVVVQPTPEPFPNAWQRRVLLWFAVAAAIVAPLGWAFARRLVQPIVGFAAAAERLGRDPTAEVLPLDGPAEVGRAAHAFNRMRIRLRSFVDDRTAMIGAISHDLRTPLTRLRFRIEDAPDNLRVGLLHDVEQMEQMISSVLTFIRDASEPGSREVLDMSMLVEDVVEEAIFVGQNVKVDSNQSAAVEVDAIGMRRLLSNLLENAVKYGGSARVRFFADQQEAVTEIFDTGPGLPADELERVFEPFYRTSTARASGKQGSGLGLAVCRSIARAHGGDVYLRQGADGLVAQLRLPLAYREAA